MSEPNVFTEGSAPATPPAPAPATIQIPDPVKEFVGEGKKYATIEEALKSIPHAQKHIETLQKKAEDAAKETDRIRAEKEAYEAYMREQREQSPPASTPSLQPEQVTELVQRSLEQQKQKEIAENNVKSVQAELASRFGDKAKEVFEARAKDLGLNLDSIARVSPKAVLELFPKATPEPNSAGSVNTMALPRVTRPPDHKPVMFGSTTEQLLEAWRNSKPA